MTMGAAVGLHRRAPEPEELDEDEELIEEDSSDDDAVPDAGEQQYWLPPGGLYGSWAVRAAPDPQAAVVGAVEEGVVFAAAPARACGWLQTRDGFLILKNGRPRGRLARYDLPHRLRPREPEPPEDS